MKLFSTERIIDEEALASAFVDGLGNLLQKGITINGHVGSFQVSFEIKSSGEVPTLDPMRIGGKILNAGDE